MVYKHKEGKFLFSGEIMPEDQNIITEITVYRNSQKNRLVFIGKVFWKKNHPLDFYFQRYNENTFEAIKIISKRICFDRIVIKQTDLEIKKRFAQKFLKKMSYRITEGVRTEFYSI